jgi:hypothetical protein
MKSTWLSIRDTPYQFEVWGEPKAVQDLVDKLNWKYPLVVERNILDTANNKSVSAVTLSARYRPYYPYVNWLALDALAETTQCFMTGLVRERNWLFYRKVF